MQGLGLTEMTAIVGAVNGTIALFTSIFFELRRRSHDRPVLLVRGVMKDGYAIIMAANAGRRVLKVKSLHATREGASDHEIWYPDGFPQVLEEHADFGAAVPLGLFDEKEPRMTGLYLLDSLGKKWPLGRRKFRRFREEACEALARYQREKAAEQKRADLKFADQVLALETRESTEGAVSAPEKSDHERDHRG